MNQVSNRFRFAFRYAGLMFAAFGLMLQACDQPAEFVPLRSLEVVQEDPLVQHFISDNPIVAGFMKPLPDMNWAAQEVDLTFQDLNTTATYWQRLSEPGAMVRAIATAPIFFDGFKIASWQTDYTRGNAEVYTHVSQARDKVAQARANGHAVRQGPHVFLGGDVRLEDPNADKRGVPLSSDGVRGLGCDLDQASHIGGPFVVAENGVNRASNVRHEMLHVFGLEHPPGQPGGGDFGEIDTATMGSSLCGKVRSFASQMAEL